MKRILALFLTIFLIVGSLPASVLAEETSDLIQIENQVEPETMEEPVSDDEAIQETLPEEDTDSGEAVGVTQENEITESVEDAEGIEEIEEIEEIEDGDEPSLTAAHTAAEALSYCESLLGTKVGTGQCVALIKAYYSYLGGALSSGNACDYATNAVPAGWSRVQGGVPQAGDILVYTGAKYGHVAIYAGGTVSYHQNMAGQYVEKKTNWPYNKSWYSSAEGGTKSYWGYIRPDFPGPGPQPTPTPTPGGDKSPIIHFDQPTQGGTYSGTAGVNNIPIEGWIVTDVDLTYAFVEVSGVAQCGLSIESEPSDVVSAYPGYRYHKRFRGVIELSKLSSNSNYEYFALFAFANGTQQQSDRMHFNTGTIKTSTPPTISASVSSLSFTLPNASSRTITITVGGGLPSSYNLVWSTSNNCVSPQWTGDWYQNDTKQDMTITANSAGSDTIRVGLYDRSSGGGEGEEIAYVNIPVTVTSTSYTLSYSANGGSGAPSSQTGSGAMTISSTIPKKFGYTFLGWGRSSTGGTEYKPGNSITLTSNTTLYAIWGSPHTISSVNTSYTPAITVAGQERYYTFTPDASATYRFESTGSDDTMVYLYNSGGTLLASNDDGPNDRNFRLDYSLTAGTTYYLMMKYYSDSLTGNINLNVYRFYTVSYNANGGSGAPSSQSKLYGELLTVSGTVPTKSYTVTYNANGGSCSTTSATKSCTFTGWNTSSSGTGTSYSKGASYSPNANATLYAQWTNPTYGSLPTPTKAGSTFEGWYTSATGGTKVTTSTSVTGNITLYAHWNSPAAITASVSSVTLDLPTDMTRTITLTAGGSIPSKYNFTREITGDCFSTSWTGEWNGTSHDLTITGLKAGTGTLTVHLLDKTESETGVPVATVNIPITVYSDIYFVSYNANGGSGAPSMQSKYYGQDLTLSSAVPTKSYTVTYNANGGTCSTASATKSCTFTGWNTSSAGTGTSYSKGAAYTTNAPVTLYAQWTNPTYGSLPTASRSNYSFDGWYTSASGGTKVTASTVVTGNITLYAHWSAQPVSITADISSLSFHLPGTSSRTITLTAGGAISTSYTFSAKITGDCISSSWTGSWNGSSHDLTVTANKAGTATLRVAVLDKSGTETDGNELAYVAIPVTVTADSYTIRFDANGGSGAPGAQSKLYGESLTLPTTVPAKSYTVTYNANGGSVSTSTATKSCTFTGWNTSSAGTGTSYSKGATYTANADATLYAQWTNPTYGTLPTPIRSGYTFDGWYTSSTGGSKVTTSTMVTANTTLYVHWINASYTLTYDANGGSSAPGRQTGTSSGSVTLSSTVPTRFSYNFLGWSRYSAAGTAEYLPGDTITLTADTTLYAVWASAPLLTPGMTKIADIQVGGQVKYYKITPVSTGTYILESGGSYDTYGILYTESGVQTASNDQGGDDSNFRIEYLMWEGETYYLMVKHYYSSMTGSFSVHADKKTVISYHSNGGSGAPADDIKMTGERVAVSSAKPKKTYTITYNANGGSISTATANVDCIFTGWNSSPSGNGTAYAPGQFYEAEEDVTLYAQWSDPSYGTLPIPTRAGYKFDGWFTSASGGSQVTNLSKVTGNVTLYAHWTSTEKPLKIISQPKNVTAGVNATVSFSVTAEGENLTYQWQYSKNGGEKWLISGATGAATDSISLKVSASNAGNIYRCRITGNGGKEIYSAAAGVDLIPGAVIIKNPQSAVAAIGEYAVFTVTVENAASYQWQYSKDGSHWYNSGAEGNKTDVLKVKGAQNSQGNRYRCVVTGVDGNKKKSLMAAMIVLQTAPKNSTAAVGQTATFSLKAEGIASYQWQYSKDGGNTWYKSGAAGAETDTVSFKVASSNKAMIYRCKLTTEDGAYAFTRPVGF